jgi:hypothetical protein
MRTLSPEESAAEAEATAMQLDRLPPAAAGLPEDCRRLMAQIAAADARVADAVAEARAEEARCVGLLKRIQAGSGGLIFGAGLMPPSEVSPVAATGAAASMDRLRGSIRELAVELTDLDTLHGQLLTETMAQRQELARYVRLAESLTEQMQSVTAC